MYFCKKSLEVKNKIVNLEKCKLLVFIDGWCPMCRKFGHRIQRTDMLHLIVIQDIRNSELFPKKYQDKALQRMASINQQQKIYFGFDTIFNIALRIPYFWILIPFLFLLKITQIGAFLYKQLALRRTIIPIHCHENCNISNYKPIK